MPIHQVHIFMSNKIIANFIILVYANLLPQVLPPNFYVKEASSNTDTLSSFFQVEDLPGQLEKMNELCHLPGFRHDAKLIEETGKSDLFKSRVFN